MTLTSSTPDASTWPDQPRKRSGVSRRGFLGYVMGASTLVVAVDLGSTAPAFGAVPSPPQIAEGYDLEDAQTDAARPTAQLITITVNKDGTASFALPADGGRPGHHHLDRDDHRRGARPAASRRCTSPWPRPVPS